MEEKKPKVKRGHREATKKQSIALQLLTQNPTMSERQAMIAAGYSTKAAGHPKRFLYEAKGVQTILEGFQLELRHRGLLTAKLAQKYEEWIDATQTKGFRVRVGTDEKGKAQMEYVEVKVPDYPTQLKAGEMLKEAWQLTQSSKNKDQQPSRRITLEEFLKE